MKTPREYATWLLWRTGLTALSRMRLVRDGRFALVLHGVASRPYPELPLEVQPCLTTGDLRTVLKWLTTRFTLLTADEFLTTGRPGALLTFDDGLANNCTNVLPVLEELRAPAVFFVSTRHVLNPRNWLPAARELVARHWVKPSDVPPGISADLFDGMSREQLARCAASQFVTIGSHTVSHPFLTRCADGQLHRELLDSKKLLEDISGKKVDLLAYPTGNYDARVVDEVRKCGYRAAFAVDPAGVGCPVLEIGRIGIYSSSRPYLSSKLSGLHRKPLKGNISASSH